MSAKATEHHAAVLERFRLRHRAGDADALLRALHYCLGFDVRPPDWVRGHVNDALQRFWFWEAESLSVAFGVERSADPRTIRSERKAVRLRGLVFERVLAARGAGRALDDGLFEEIGRDLAISRTKAREYWRDARQAVRLDDINFPRKKKYTRRV